MANYKKAGICRRYNTPNGCRFGDGCRFSHVDQDQRSKTSAYTRNDAHTHKMSQTTDDLFVRWRYMVPRDEFISQPLGGMLGRFFQLALDLVNTDPAALQEVIQRLSAPGGIQRIRELCERAIDFPSDTVFVEQAMPFLKILAHPVVLLSPSLEESVLRIYSYIGHNTVRFGDLFELVVSQLKVSFNPMQPAEHILIPIVVLSKLLDSSADASVNDKMREIATELAALSRSNQFDLDDAAREEIHKLLRRIDKRLRLGLAIPAPNITVIDGCLTKPKFVFRQPPPGGRHDNDHGDICKISILPTIAETRSILPEFLPPEDPDTWQTSPEDPVSGLLDRQFRLLREDSVGPLREAVRETMEDIQKGSWRSSNNQSKSGLRTFGYDNVQVTRVEADPQIRGMVFWVSFPQPKNLRKSGVTAQQRKQWWDHSRRLKAEALVCLFDAHRNGDMVFCTVVMDHEAGSGKDKQNKDEVGSSLRVEHDYWVSLRLAVTDSDEHAIEFVLKNFPRVDQSQWFTLVEFPGILLPGFEPVLKALQDMKKSGHLPFADLIAPPPVVSSVASIDPPTYARARDFRFNLRSVMKGVDCYLQPGKPFDLSLLEQQSSLDRAQAKAVVNALITKFAFIQGPPGTGKSYCGIEIIRILLDNKELHASLRGNRSFTGLGPILVVCYTNHALDQLLEHLLRADIKQIIRIGSRSKSELVKPLNLRQVVRDNGVQTKQEKGQVWNLKNSLGKQKELLTHTAIALAKAKSWDSVKFLAEAAIPGIASTIENLPDEDGFQQVQNQKQKKGPDQVFRRWLDDKFDGTQRKSLHREWTQKVKDKLLPDFKRRLDELLNIQRGLEMVRSEEELRCLQQANIVGVTSSGLARNLKLLRRLRCKAVVVEEAGELLESHSLVSLLPSIEHAIFIGDHLQLRPQINTYDLKRESRKGAEYSLDVSLFERLVTPREGIRAVKIPFTTLETQRRMHPSISRLIRNELYPTLNDAPTVQDYPEVQGIRKRLFWLDHEELEAGAEDEHNTTTHWNQYEIDMTINLVSHLIKQGTYSKPEDLAVITPYLGQLHRLREQMRHHFEIVVSDRDEEDLEQQGINDTETSVEKHTTTNKSSMLQAIRLATVDNFQGEEASVVIISLVRSNKEGKVGFLKTSNRINVLLSRAKHGMYIIGNASTARSVPFWEKTIQTLEADECVGKSLQLVCPRHSSTPIEVSKPKDFGFSSPEGGCRLRCSKRLLCGHICLRMCHSDVLHRAVHCLEPCARLLECKHPCLKQCYETCEQHCKVPIRPDKGFTLPCSHHVDTLDCYYAEELSRYVCEAKVQRKLPYCSHIVELPCCVDVQSHVCTEICGAILPCGHTCKRPCYLCRSHDPTQPEEHGSCISKCGRKYTTCPHSCDQVCHTGNCKPCPARCQSRCDHSRCSKSCHEPCSPCVQESCTSGCEHSSCPLPCAVPCSHIPCSRRCSKNLECGHQCPTLCTEKCPSSQFCQICSSDEIKNSIVDYIIQETYIETDLNEDPIIIPACGHLITTSNLDGVMEMKGHYDIGNDGITINSLTSRDEPFSNKEMKFCPQCRGSLMGINRYSRILRRAFLDESSKKFVTWANAKFMPIMQSFYTEQNRLAEMSSAMNDSQDTARYFRDDIHLSGNPLRQIKTLRQFGVRRHAALIKLHSEIHIFRKAVSVAEQPFQRVYERVEALRARGRELLEFKFDNTLIQTGFEVKATALQIRCELLLLQDLLNIHKETSNPLLRTLTIGFTNHLAGCRTLVDNAISARLPRSVAEGHIFYAKYKALSKPYLLAGDGDGESCDIDALSALDKAQEVLSQHSATTAGLAEEIDLAKKLINGGVFYQPMTSEEMQAVVSAMASEFYGTGHWYRCVNGHPFTVGECGMPMERAHCPECGGRVGGANHQPDDGVVHASDIEREFGNMTI